MKKVFISLYLLPEQKDILTEAARKNRRSVSQQILWFLQQHINIGIEEEQNEKPPKRKLLRIKKEIGKNDE